MLLNIVRSRYQDMPVFLTVNSVTTQYSYISNVGLGAVGEVNPATSTVTGAGNLSYTYSEFPTITYEPITGESFVKHLYSKLEAATLLAAAQSGWAVDILMLIGLHRIGAVENMSFSEVHLKQSDISDAEKLVRFARAIDLLHVLTDAEVIEFQKIKSVEKNDKKDSKTARLFDLYMIFKEEVPENMRSFLTEFRQLTGITNSNRLKVVERSSKIDSNEVSIQSRSIMSVIKFLGRGIEIPLEYLEEGRVIDLSLKSEDGEAERLFPFRMHSSEDEPENVFAAVEYQDYWYYIDHNDITSKRTLEHIMILFELKAPFSKSSAPILTIPTR